MNSSSERRKLSQCNNMFNISRSVLSKFRIFSATAFLFSFLLSCSSAPQPIEIGKDLCELCKMTIMDKRFGAELITAKGKIYKFDSAECLIAYLNINPLDQNPVKALLVIDHSVSGQLIDAKSAYYLHSEKLPSPMGANLSAVQNRETIDEYFSEYGGEIWTWEEARLKLR